MLLDEIVQQDDVKGKMTLEKGEKSEERKVDAVPRCFKVCEKNLHHNELPSLRIKSWGSSKTNVNKFRRDEFGTLRRKVHILPFDWPPKSPKLKAIRNIERKWSRNERERNSFRKEETCFWGFLGCYAEVRVRYRTEGNYGRAVKSGRREGRGREEGEKRRRKGEKQKSNDSLVGARVYWRRCRDGDAASWQLLGDDNDWRCGSMLPRRCQLSYSRRFTVSCNADTSRFFSILSLPLPHPLSQAHMHAPFLFLVLSARILVYLPIYAYLSLPRSVQTDDPPWSGRHFFDTAHTTPPHRQLHRRAHAFTRDDSRHALDDGHTTAGRGVVVARLAGTEKMRGKAIGPAGREGRTHYADLRTARRHHVTSQAHLGGRRHRSLAPARVRVAARERTLATVRRTRWLARPINAPCAIRDNYRRDYHARRLVSR